MKTFSMELAQEIGYVGEELARMLSVDSANRRHNIIHNNTFSYATMVLLTGKMGRVTDEQINILAMAIEMLGLAIQAHDDIFDLHLCSNQKYSDPIEGEMLSGDFCFAQSFRLLSFLKPLYMKSATAIVEDVIEWEFQKRNNRYNFQWTVKEYIKWLAQGRPRFFSLSMISGALAGGLDKQETDALAAFGTDVCSALEIKREMNHFVRGHWDYQWLLEGIPSLPLLLYFEMEGFSMEKRIGLAKDIKQGYFSENQYEGLLSEMEHVKNKISCLADDMACSLHRRGLEHLEAVPYSPARVYLEEWAQLRVQIKKDA